MSLSLSPKRARRSGGREDEGSSSFESLSQWYLNLEISQTGQAVPGTHRYQDPRELDRANSGLEHCNPTLKVLATSISQIAGGEQLKW